MKLSQRIFFSYCILVITASLFFFKSISDELRPAMRQSMEDTLVDTANLLAEIIEKDVVEGSLSNSQFSASVDDFLSRKLDANIWGLSKKTIEYRIYVTDSKGIVIYDSDGGGAVGEDYSLWNDVYLTLQGKYGARSTPSKPGDDSTSIMYIAAPIYSNQNIVGVVSVSKPSVSVLPFVQRSQYNIIQAVSIMLLIALVMAWLFSRLLTSSTRRLVSYANQVKEGEKTLLPNVKEKELSELAAAIDSMRKVLEGKEYAKEYVHSLTHEIKSPLSGIMGACELLNEEMPIEDRQHFIGIVRGEAQRIKLVVEKLLDLAQLEQLQALGVMEPINISHLCQDILDALSPQLSKKCLAYDLSIDKSLVAYGDLFLLSQALNNILINAIDFSPCEGKIEVYSEIKDNVCELWVSDGGCGIPEYAKDKVFERFYSLPRPDTGKKSTGLGLSLVREIMSLHKGSVQIYSTSEGCRVKLVFPVENTI